MLKLLRPGSEKFQKYKCGEVFLETPTTYCIGCRLCGKKLAFDEFPLHFQRQHIVNKDGSANRVREDQEEELDKLQSTHNNETVVKSECEDDDATNSGMECIPAVLLEQEQPIAFTEFNKLNSSTAFDFMPEHNVIDEAHLEETLDTWPQDSGSGSMENDEDNASECSKQNVQINSENDDKIKSDDAKFNCNICSRAYKTNRGLQHHIRISHEKSDAKQNPKKKYKCEVCGKILNNEYFLQCHMLRHTGFTCTICGKAFTQLCNLTSHKKRHTGVKDHKCQECGLLFFTTTELKQHAMRHTDSLPVICEICGQLFRNTSVLRAHMRRHTGERPAKCTECGKSFYSFHDLNVHSVTHTTDRPFGCDVCGSTFQTRKSLRTHTRKIHSVERKHVCQVCEKAFAHAGALETHIKREHQRP